eukprot:SAG11_NODE_22034_length_413_cov_1.149682_1_plen_21_part_01
MSVQQRNGQRAAYMEDLWTPG